ncbi:hypothetical protein V12B01_12985 [Vibrio splendidus 12B01]|nr:hypothetical protein V12B01_12985 [Vibrio splendidus 12B01]
MNALFFTPKSSRYSNNNLRRSLSETHIL